MLRIKGLCKTYDNGVQALKNVNLEIPNGMFGLLGPNGAGKSSLMRTIATLQQCDQGSIHLDDVNVLTQPQQTRQIMGYLPQDFGVYPRFSAQKMLNHFAALKGITHAGEREDTVAGLLAMVNLWDVRHQKLGTYSGGMLQRFGVAQALLGNPRLVIVDEPAAGLDPEERNRLLNLLSEIGEQVVVILSTHQVENVRDLCRQMAILVGGQVVAEGQPRDLIAQMKNKVWATVVTKAQVHTYQQRHQVLSTRLYAGGIALRVQNEVSPGPEFEPAETGLEDIYFSTIRFQKTRKAIACKS